MDGYVDKTDACFNDSDKIYAEISAKNADFKKMIEAMISFRNDHYLWWQVAKFGFDNYMVRARSRNSRAARQPPRARVQAALKLGHLQAGLRLTN